MKQIEYLGNSAINELNDLINQHKPGSIFLVTGKSSYQRSGAADYINRILSSHPHVRFSDFTTNPKLEEIMDGVELIKQHKCEMIVAVGGGSVIDMAKSINIFAANPGDPTTYIKRQKGIEDPGSIMIAIPTTAGSGSEGTHFAVVYDGKTKYSIAHEYVLPDYAIVDPKLTISLPPAITASTGMDALAQAIESYWNINSTLESQNYAKQAIELVASNLEAVVNNPTPDARLAMAKAAHLAGKAINLTKTTSCHAISYPITSYFGVPHGHAVALTLPQMLIYNSQVTDKDALDPRGTRYVRQTIQKITEILQCTTPAEASIQLTALMQSIGLATTLSGVGIITQEHIDLIVKNGFNPDRVKNNPRMLTEEALREILSRIA